VLGHIDFTAPIVSFEKRGDHRELLVEIPPAWESFFVEKGSVALDGISLTVNRLLRGAISLNIIPYTYERTNLRSRRVGDMVNVEADILGKYVLRYLSRRGASLEESLSRLFGK